MTSNKFDPVVANRQVAGVDQNVPDSPWATNSMHLGIKNFSWNS